MKTIQSAWQAMALNKNLRTCTQMLACWTSHCINSSSDWLRSFWESGEHVTQGKIDAERVTLVFLKMPTWGTCTCTAADVQWSLTLQFKHSSSVIIKLFFSCLISWLISGSKNSFNINTEYLFVQDPLSIVARLAIFTRHVNLFVKGSFPPLV